MGKTSLFMAMLCLAATFSSCDGAHKPVSHEAFLNFEDSVHDFGVVRQSADSVSHIFVFHNNGEQSLVIQKVETSCHCTIADYPKEPIMAGKKGDLAVTFDAKGSLPVNFSKTITVYSNSKGGPAKLTIKGKVIPK